MNRGLQATLKHSGTLQVWGCFLQTDLVTIDGVLTVEKYMQIFIHHAVPSERHLIIHNFILQNANDPKPKYIQNNTYLSAIQRKINLLTDYISLMSTSLSQPERQKKVRHPKSAVKL